MKSYCLYEDILFMESLRTIAWRICHNKVPYLTIFLFLSFWPIHIPNNEVFIPLYAHDTKHVCEFCSWQHFHQTDSYNKISYVNTPDYCCICCTSSKQVVHQDVQLFFKLCACFLISWLPWLFNYWLRENKQNKHHTNPTHFASTLFKTQVLFHPFSLPGVVRFTWISSLN